MRAGPTNLPDDLAGRRRRLLGAALIAAAILAAYAGTFRSPFQFDDFNAIVANPTIHQLWPLQVPLSPPASGTNVHGRPLVNLSLAFNYAIGGTDVRGYHAVNLLLHGLAALTLFGIVRRSALRWPGPGTVPAAPATTACAVALLWAVHPLLTESVTCIIQRTEVLVGLLYLLTLYLFIRALESARPARWLTGAVITCLAGMASKEVMVTAPVLVLFYDRTFGAGSFREAWRRRRTFHLAMAATWLLLAALMFGAPQRGGTVGFGLGVSPWDYLLTQCHAIALYLKLSLWPHPLVVDYGNWVAPGLGAVLPQALLVAALIGATALALWRRPALGWMGAWFFGILAPSSSFVPLATQTMAEHRMYLPLAAVVALVVLGLQRVAARFAPVMWATLAVAAIVATEQRNRVYASELSLWSDTVAKRPGNFRAHDLLGAALARVGRLPEALTHFTEAVRLNPHRADLRINLSDALLKTGSPAAAAQQAQEALRMSPDDPDAHNNLANALAALGNLPGAIAHYELALSRQPDAEDIHRNLAAAYLRVNDLPAAVAHFRTAVQLDPSQAQPWYELACALEQQGEVTAARAAVERALRLQPRLPEALFLRGNLEVATENLPAAIASYREALLLAPDHLAARSNLASALLLTGDLDAAIAEFRTILRRHPDEGPVRENLERALELQRRRTGR